MDVMAQVVLRPIDPTDAEAVTDLHIAVWEEAYAGLMPESVFVERREGRTERIERWHQIIASSAAPTIVAEYDGALVGFASAGPGRDDDIEVAEELWALYVRASWWGSGLGHRLLTDALGDRPAYVWVLRGNERGIGFYERQGFALDGAEHDDPPLGTELRMVRT